MGKMERVTPLDIKGLAFWFDASNAGHDMFGRVYMLNLVRPLTLWRRFRARIGWHEKDSMRSGFINKPKIVKVGGRKAVEYNYDWTKL